MTYPVSRGVEGVDRPQQASTPLPSTDSSSTPSTPGLDTRQASTGLDRPRQASTGLDTSIPRQQLDTLDTGASTPRHHRAQEAARNKQRLDAHRKSDWDDGHATRPWRLDGTHGGIWTSGHAWAAPGSQLPRTDMAGASAAVSTIAKHSCWKTAQLGQTKTHSFPCPSLTMLATRTTSDTFRGA
eukprot:CAMPEP_0196713054 /NCGR_PEP_ID=MMETSP1090-20130531/75017_1 /TAXON_ID=37098 /ORGANISM="Isochrysis sp, Strain CCMP1244" /LENGTH=183 /DNA_ID=CAMNT_0042053153 /DNA_START=290 /DNA_END=838 /DNA_ORIENTATION=-